MKYRFRHIVINRHIALLTLVGALVGVSPIGIAQGSSAIVESTSSTVQRTSWADAHVAINVRSPAQTTVTTSFEPVVVSRGTAEQLALVEDALGSFADAGMALPDLMIRFWDDRESCDGYLGVFRTATWAIDICSELPFVLPHEMGHAWERANLSDASRDTYMATYGFEFWQEGTTVRNEQAIEDVAFVIQLVILGGGRSGRSNVDQAFDLLVGLAAI